MGYAGTYSLVTGQRMHFHQWKRRDFISLLGGTAATWPLAARAQQGERMRRIGVLVNLPANDAATQARIGAFRQALQELGWSEGGNLRIEYRWTEAGDDELGRYAQELVALSPEVIMGAGSPSVVALRKATRTIPIVFALVADPVGAGFVESLARPGGNATGFTPFEYTIGAKWLELLRAIAPNVTRAAVLREATNSGAMGQFVAVQSAASMFGMDLRPIDSGSNEDEIKRAVATFAREPNSGLIVTATPMANIHRELIIALAKQHRLPAVYGFRFHVERGGLIAYAPDALEQYRRAAGYVDRILRGEKPADLPVQAPTKYELVINLKTAKALDLTVPPSLLALADAVIE
jgi:putative tryptophan/tyrosine transport system substrate-binding protein